MSEELTFEFEGEIITALDADTTEPVFIADPIAKKLGHRDAFNMLRGLDPDEKGTHNVSTLGGPQEMSVITLPGLIHALNNRRPGAIKDETMRGMVIRFQRWVNHEVIPSILKHGRYELPNRHLLEAGHHERMRQVELLKASQGLVHPDFLEAKTRIVIARELGEAPELDPKTRPLYTQDYLRGKNLGSRKLKSVAPTFGKRLKKLYVERHGREPMLQDMTLPTGRIIKACAYTEADRPLFDEVWKQFDPNTGGGLMAEPVLWSPQEAADCLGRSVKTLGKWRSLGQGPAYLRDSVSGRISYVPDVVLAWKKANLQRRTETQLGDCRRLK